MTQRFYTNVKQQGNNILYIGYENGQRIQKKIPFKPILFIQDSTDSKDSKYSTYTGTKVSPVNFDTIKEAKDFINTYKNVDNFSIYGTNQFANEYIARNFPEHEIQYNMQDIRVFVVDIENKPTDTGDFADPHKAEGEITAITVYDSKTKKYHFWGIKNYNPNKIPEGFDQISDIRKDIITHIFLDNEGDMLYDFVSFWSQNYPDIVTGWNSRFYDIPYIINRLRKKLGDKITNTLSPWGVIKESVSNIKRFGQTTDEIQYELLGIAELDELDLYKKYGTNEESYKLGYIGQKNLGITKVEFDGTLMQLFEEDYQTYADYNVQDVNLIVQLEKQKRFIDLIVQVSYLGKGATYNDSLGTVKFWEMLIYANLYGKNQVTEIKNISESKDDKFAGAFVKDTINGLHRFVVSFDFASLYPSLIRQVNIGPETRIPEHLLPDAIKQFAKTVSIEKIIDQSLDTSILKKYNYSMSSNAQFYKRDAKGFLSEIVGEIFEKRKKIKKQMLSVKQEYNNTKDKSKKELAEKMDIQQLALKILINAVYGALGNAYFQYFSLANAEAVTSTGQTMTRYVINKINAYLNSLLKTNNIDRIVASDTDSCYIVLDEVVKAVFKDKPDATMQQKIDFVDRFCEEKLTPLIEKECEKMADYLNSYENMMNMKREAIAETAVWIGKKRYFMSIWDNEGVKYNPPMVKMTGVQAISTSTPNICRKSLKEALNIILLKDEKTLQNFIKDFKIQFDNANVVDIARPTGITDIEKYTTKEGYYGKGTPAHVKACIIYNKLLKEHKLDKKLEKIKNGSKVKWVYLKKPNIIQDDAIGFIDKLPKQFNLDKVIDFDLQFEKTFLSPIRDITDIIGWKLYESNNLEDLFF